MPTQAELQAYATQAAQKYGVPTSFFLAQINQESGWNPTAANGSAYGLAQVQAATAANPGYGVTPLSDPADPYKSLDFAAQYDAALYKQSGSWSQVAKSYGTIPSTGNLTAGQTAVASAAAAADNTSGEGVGLGGTSGAGTSDTGEGIGLGGTGGTTGVTPASNSSGGIMASIWEVVERAGVILLGLTLLVVALIAMLFRGKQSIIPVPL